ncbi:MAG: hypothetical protein JWR55_650 [Aeromicrobium sp.]|jgi:hypothetical protein|nr:hypothetical protein [Aeromicrobium sp.]
MKKLTIKLAASIVCASTIPVVGLASAAEAVTCVYGTHYTSTESTASTQFSATSDCDGVYAGTAYSAADRVRGRFHKDGGWQISSYGFVWIYTGDDGYDKIIGNTTTGRLLKGQGDNVSQNVGYLY